MMEVLFLLRVASEFLFANWQIITLVLCVLLGGVTIYEWFE